MMSRMRFMVLSSGSVTVSRTFPAVDDHECREALEAGNLLDGCVVGEQAGVGHAHFLRERFDDLASVRLIGDALLEIEADDLKTLVLTMAIKVDQERDRLAAWPAPGAPEVDQDNLSLEVGERDRFGIEVAMGELERQVDFLGELFLDPSSSAGESRGVMRL